MVWNDTMFVDIVRSVVSYARTFEDEHNIAFFNARTSDIAQEMITSEFLSSESLSMYLQYARVGKLMMRLKELPAIVEKLSAEKEPRFRFAVTLLDDFRVNGQTSEVVLLLIHAAHQNMNNPNKDALCRSTVFYNARLYAFRQLGEIYDTLDKTAVPTFLAFMDTPVKATPNLYQSVQLVFMNKLRLVESVSGENRG